MKWSNCEKMRLALVGVVSVIVIGAGSVKADFTFGEPVNLGPTVNSSYTDTAPCISSDGLSLYFQSERPGISGGRDIFVTTRPTVADDWGSPVNVGPPVSGPFTELNPDISTDSLELYFISTRPGGFGLQDIWVSRRVDKDDAWGEPVNLGPFFNSAINENGPAISDDGLELYFNSNGLGGFGAHDLFVARRETTIAPWGKPVNLGPVVNRSSEDSVPSISSDGLRLFFADHSGGNFRDGGLGGGDIWMTARPTREVDWGLPVNLGPRVNTSSHDGVPDISSDGSVLYFKSNRSGGLGLNDLYQVPINPIVDFNGDGIVDSADMVIMVDHWGTDNSLCDIGPMPWGDGIVDVEDLKVLAEHLFEEPTLIAQWAFDETEGIYAADSVSENNAIVVGGATWQPSGGQKGGALQLDGVSGCVVITNSILNPADGPFSIFAWIKGGAPGQVIVSQRGAANWLIVDADDNLMTELKAIGPSTSPLFSETLITDGQWHRIGFIWDGSNRTLCVDGIMVAEDTHPGLDGSQMGLYIGVDKNRTSGTFFSGLIDDVRIYNRAVSP